MNGRLMWVDAVKGILIILVVIGHIIPPDINSDIVLKFRLWIYSCHIPGFFILNGWLKGNGSFLSLGNLSEVFLKQRRVWLMYILFSSIFFFRYVVQISFGYNTFYEGLLFLEHTILGVGEGVLWFIPAFLIAEIFFFSYMKNKRLGGGVIVIMVCLLLLKPYLNIKNISAISSVPILLYIVLMRSFVGFIFMIVGYIFYKYKLFEKKIMFLLSLGTTYAYMNHDVDINNLVFYNEILFVLFAILGCTFIVNISKVIIKCNSVSKILSMYGKESLFVMLTHTIFFVIQGSLIVVSMCFSLQITSLVLTIVLSLVIEYILVLFKKRLFDKYGFLKKYLI